MPDASTQLPPGVWEPDPGTDRTTEVSLVGDGDHVWFAYNRDAGSQHPTIWLTQTTSDGATTIPPVRVDSDAAAYLPAVSVAGTSIVVAHVGTALWPYVRFFERDGSPRGENVRVSFSIGGASPDTHALALVATTNGDSHLLAGTSDPVYEAMALELDPAGAVRTSTPLGALGVFATERVAATLDTNGDIVDAWDRVHDYCTQTVPYETSSALVRGGVAQPEQIVRDVPTLGEFSPTLSPSFAAWGQHDSMAPRMTIALANLADPSSTIELGDPAAYNHTPALAEESPGNAAIAWNASDGPIHVARVHRDGTGAVVVGALHTIEPVSSSGTLAGIASIEASRYVVAWIEPGDGTSHLYATTVDVSHDPAARTARRVPGRVTPSPRGALGLRPCTH